jgi:diaminopropionate ammonia-lyase
LVIANCRLELHVIGDWSREIEAARRFYDAAPDAAPTPLRPVPRLAAELGLDEILVKDESNRFGLPAFKILGARYAVARLLAAGSGVRTLACATAGNHGRAVARAAREHNLAARVFVPEGTARAQVAALESEGAVVTATTVGYDDTVRLMSREAGARGWTVVSDTSWDGYEEVPRWIMAGYTRLMDEASRQWNAPPDAIVVQAGVGSLAGAVAAWIDHALVPGSQDPGLRKTRPRFVVAEPVGSACVQASVRAGRRVTLESCAPTAMVGLRCAEVSPVAWRALDGRVDATVTISEEQANDAVRRLAEPHAGDPRIQAGASGACGLAAVTALMQDPSLAATRESLGLDRKSRVMAIVTEGPTG